MHPGDRSITWWAARPAAVLACALGLACSASVPADADPAGAPVDYSRSGAVRHLGAGTIGDFTADGSAVLALREDGRFAEQTCEGVPQPVLYRVPLDGSPAELVEGGPGGEPLRGTVLRGPADAVALLNSCEEHLGEIVAGREPGAGCRIHDAGAVPYHTPAEGFPSVGGWSASGRHLLIHTRLRDRDDVAQRIDVATGQAEDLYAGEFNDVGELADGRLVIASDDEVRILGPDGRHAHHAFGWAFAIDRTHRQVAVYGGEAAANQITVLRADGTTTRLRAPDEHRVSEVAWSHDGTALAYVARARKPGTAEEPDWTYGASHLRVADLSAGTDAALTEPGNWFSPRFSPYGQRLAVGSHSDSDPSPGIHIIEFRRR